MFDQISIEWPSNEEDPNISGTLEKNVAAGLGTINNLDSGHPYKLVNAQQHGAFSIKKEW